MKITREDVLRVADLAYLELSAPVAEVQVPAEMSADWTLGEANAATDAKQSVQRRTEACANLVSGLPKLPRPKLATMREVQAKLRTAYHAEANADVRGSLAGALAKYHREFHEIYKPDEVVNPTGAPAGDKRAIRGGGYNASQPLWLNPAFRFHQIPSARVPAIVVRRLRRAIAIIAAAWFVRADKGRHGTGQD